MPRHPPTPPTHTIQQGIIMTSPSPSGPPSPARRRRRRPSSPLPLLFLLLAASAAVVAPTPAQRSTKVQSLLASMSLEEKVGQMLQLDLVGFLEADTLTLNTTRLAAVLREYHVGSILNSPFGLGPSHGKDGWTAGEWKGLIRQIHQTSQEVGVLPPVYGIDSVHGANYIYGATIFPQQINAAASFNRDLVKAMGRVQGKDTKAGGIPWLFAPILGINTQPLWSRSFETFGECPYVAAEMGKAIIRGIQIEDDPEFPGLPPAAACMKHFIAYPAAVTGHDRSPIELNSRTVKQLYAPPFTAAVQEAGVKSAMEAYTEVSGVPMASSKEYLVDLLREEMGFEGMLVTDYNEIANLHQFHFVAEDMPEAVELAMKDTSIDMSMNPPLAVGFADAVLDLVRRGVVSEERVDASVARVLALKEWLGLLDDPFHLLDDFPLLEASVGSAADKEAALALARESIVLLENPQSLLPLEPAAMVGKKVFVTGQGCNSLGMQSGGWTLHWQGARRNSVFTAGTTYFEGLKERFPLSEVWYHPGVTVAGTDIPGQREALRHAKEADVIVACVGEPTYAEKPGDVNDLSLPAGQLDYIEKLTAVGPPVVAVLVEGRARVLGSALDKVSAVLDAMLVGPSGGEALAEIIAGDVNPSARLPFTYPRFTGVAPQQYYRKPSSLCTTGRVVLPFTYIDCPRQWEFGHGLSYTSFAYQNASLSATTIDENTPLVVSLTVMNTGRRRGKEAVLLFVTDKVRRVTPEYKMLRRFEKVELEAGATQELSFTLDPKTDLSFIGIDNRRQLESGLFYIGLGPHADCRARPQECLSFTLSLSSKYDVLCEAGCAAWSKAGGKEGGREGGREDWPAVYEGLVASEENCHETCLAHRAQVPASWSEAYVQCVEREGRTAAATAATAVTATSPASPPVWQHLATACWNPALPPASSCPVAAVAPLLSLTTLQVQEVGNGTGSDNNNDDGSSSGSSSNNSTDDDPTQAGSNSKEGGEAPVKVSAGELIGFVISAALLCVGIVFGVIRFGKYLLHEGGWRRAVPLSSGRSTRSGSGGSIGGSGRSSSRGLPLLDVREDEEDGEEEEGGGRGRREADLY